MRVRMRKILRWGVYFMSAVCKKKKKKNPQRVEGAKKIANSKNGFLKCNLRGLMVLRGILCPELKRVSPALLFKSGFTWNIGDKSGLLPLTETLTNQKKRRQQLRWVRTWNQISSLLSVLQARPFQDQRTPSYPRPVPDLTSYPSPLTALQPLWPPWHSSHITHLSWQGLCSLASPTHTAHPLSSVRPVSNVTSSWGPPCLPT